MDVDVQERVRLAARQGVRARVLLVLWQLVLFPLGLLAVHEVLDLRTATDPVFFGLVAGTLGAVYYSGQSWKERDRVQTLLEPGDTPRAVVPAVLPGAGVRERALRGCFVVLTERQALAFAYNRLLDAPVRSCASAARAECEAESDPGGGIITVRSEAGDQTFTVKAGGWRALQKFVAELADGRG
ncbi:hypothetical protein [Streptomyces triticagri]|nr:hypothetical protein [Streptomyces triticagri]